MKLFFLPFVLIISVTVLSNEVVAQENSWASGVPMPTRRVAPAAASVNNILYVVGGFTDSAGAYSIVEAYDPSLNTWTARNPMPTARGRLAVAVIDSVIYAVGGFGGQNTVEAYNTSTNTWTTKAPVNKGRLGAAAGIIDGKLYVVGGTTFDSVQTVEEYNPLTNSWTFKTRMPTPRYLLAAVVIGSKLYAVGGTNSVTGGSALGLLEVYTPATDSWETKAPMPTPRSDLAAAVIDGKMYVAGGFGSSGVGIVLEVYDPVLNTWSSLPSMPTSRGDLAAGVLNNKLYAIGGTSAPGAPPHATVEVYTPAGVTSIDEGDSQQLPWVFMLHQNYPNPFNPTTEIGFRIVDFGNVSLKVFDVLGREVATLVNEEKSPGSYSVRWDADAAGNGTYFCRLESGGRREVRKMLLIK